MIRSTLAVLLLTTGLAIAQAPAGPVKVSQAVVLASRVKFVAPKYPELAKAAGVQGMVHMSVVISKEGKVINIVVLSGPDLLRASAVDAVSGWEYRPTFLNGEPVEIITDVQVNFTLAQ